MVNFITGFRLLFLVPLFWIGPIQYVPYNKEILALYPLMTFLQMILIWFPLSTTETVIIFLILKIHETAYSSYKICENIMFKTVSTY